MKKHLGYFKRRRFKSTFTLIKDIFSKDILYFRMPKVASDSVAQGLDKDVGSVYHFFRPKMTQYLLSLNPKAFKFTFVRHPLDRFSSAYKWAVRDGICPFAFPEDYRQKEVINSYSDINDFCQQLPNLLSSKKKSLNSFLSTI